MNQHEWKGRIPTTLIYCRRDDEILLMLRHKQPNKGLWVAPGGKIELSESPYECALRELREETGLRANHLHFRGLVTETSPRADWQWMLFIYLTTDFTGAVVPDDREGALRWWPIAQVYSGAARMPQADQIFVPHILDLDRPFYDARYVYDDALRLIEIHNMVGEL
ncbi:MAG: 8-oxo-dGTP diphosphatase [Anaerolineae bacterium]|nr:8-oxo-dGTP diphosphatase [Anaerolineae bacterium]